MLAEPKKMFNEAEETGSSITYRCPKCRNYKQREDHKSIEMMNIRGEFAKLK